MRNGTAWQPVENITKKRRDVVILPPVADEPRCSIKHRLESVQKARRRAGELAVVAVHPRSDKGGDNRLRSPKGQRLDAAPDETELAKATADCPRNMPHHRQVRLQQDAKIAHRGRGPYQGYTDTRLIGVKMHTPSTGRTPHEVRFLGVKTQSVGTHPFGD